jgi:hypothetical protein
MHVARRLAGDLRDERLAEVVGDPPGTYAWALRTSRQRISAGVTGIPCQGGWGAERGGRSNASTIRSTRPQIASRGFEVRIRDTTGAP